MAGEEDRAIKGAGTWHLAEQCEDFIWFSCEVHGIPAKGATWSRKVISEANAVIT